MFKDKYTVLVCGGRDYKDFVRLGTYLDNFHRDNHIELLIQGGAKGADELGKDWAHMNMIPHLEVPANWSKYGKRAGFIRNSKMLTFSPDIIIAFPGGKGTDMMCRLAETREIEVIRVSA